VNSVKNNTAIKWLAIGGVWLLVTAIFTSQFYAKVQLSLKPFPLWQAFLLQLASSSGWFAVTPLILWLGRRFPIKQGNFFKSLPVHIVAGACVVVILQALDAFTIPMLGYPTNAASKTYRQQYREFLLLNFHVNYLIYWMVVGIQNLFALYHEYRERELRAAKLEGQLIDARLQALKNQLHPHFFFNTLNAISALMYRSPSEANRMITLLGDLIRASLKRDKEDEIALKEELEFLQAYLKIHQILMGKRLQIEWQIDPETLDALVPNLILQPLAENAIQHGLAPLEEGGRITIFAKRENKERLFLRLSDNGNGFISKNGGDNDGGGIGILNTRARLENLYNGKHTFSIVESAGGTGVAVIIEIPFRKQTPKEK